MTEDKEKETELAVNVLLRAVDEQWNQIRHLEDQRATFTNIVIVVSVGIVGFIVQQGISIAIVPLAVMLIMLGLYGAIASAKFYERYRFHQKHAAFWNKRINQLAPKANLIELGELASKEHLSQYAFISKMRVNTIWTTFNIIIAIVGIALTILGLIK
ncbi:MAG: hypothetical protein WA821_03290 [Anaerolineales bacterium]